MECCKLPQRGLGRSPSENRILCILPLKSDIIIIIIIIIIIMQRLTRHVSVIRMANRRRGGHVDLRVAVSVIKRFEFLFESVCNDVQVASDDVR